MKQPLIESDAIACTRAIRLADCVVAKLIICYLMALTHCIDEANYTVAELGIAAQADRSGRQVI
jgi:hypothetical protein